MYSFILATAAGSGPAIAVFTRVTISASRVGEANACSRNTSRSKHDSQQHSAAAFTVAYGQLQGLSHRQQTHLHQLPTHLCQVHHLFCRLNTC